MPKQPTIEKVDNFDATVVALKESAARMSTALTAANRMATALVSAVQTMAKLKEQITAMGLAPEKEATLLAGLNSLAASILSAADQGAAPAPLENPLEKPFSEPVH